MRKIAAAAVALATLALADGPPAFDASKPASLPPTAKPVPYRIPVGDPTADHSAKGVLSAGWPEPVKPTALPPAAIPNPFELRDQVKLDGPPPAETLPPEP